MEWFPNEIMEKVVGYMDIDTLRNIRMVDIRYHAYAVPEIRKKMCDKRRDQDLLLFLRSIVTQIPVSDRDSAYSMVDDVFCERDYDFSDWIDELVKQGILSEETKRDSMVDVVIDTPFRYYAACELSVSYESMMREATIDQLTVRIILTVSLALISELKRAPHPYTTIRDVREDEAGTTLSLGLLCQRY